MTTETSRAALLKLFADSQQALRNYVRKLVKSRETTDDIVQEAFLRTYQQTVPVETPRAFLFATARNLAFDVARHKRVRKTDSYGDFAALNVVASEESVEGALLADEQSRLLREAMEQLTPRCRAVFALRIFHSCSYQEIAQYMFDFDPSVLKSNEG
jgi:RNA polymerase sigma factor (sigma-70 family)